MGPSQGVNSQGKQRNTSHFTERPRGKTSRHCLIETIFSVHSGSAKNGSYTGSGHKQPKTGVEPFSFRIRNAKFEGIGHNAG